jgi:hypothetical protein
MCKSICEFIIVNVSITFRLIASFYLWTVSYMNIWQRAVYLSNTFLLWLSIKIFRRVVRKKMVVREVNKKERLSWCLERRRWTVNWHWNQVIFSDESQIVIGQNNRVYVWRSSNVPCNAPPDHNRHLPLIWRTHALGR